MVEAGGEAVDERVDDDGEPEPRPAKRPLTRRAAMLVEERPHVRAELAADARGKREQQRPVREIRKPITHGSAPRPRRQQALRARLGDQRFETAGLGRRDALTERCQSEVAATFVGDGAPGRAGLFDQAVVERPGQGAIEVPGQYARGRGSVLERSDDGPAVARAVGQGEQDLEDERLERAVHAGARGHARDGTLKM